MSLENNLIPQDFDDNPLIPIERFQSDALHEIIQVLTEMKPLKDNIWGDYNNTEKPDNKKDYLNRAADILYFLDTLQNNLPQFHAYLNEADVHINLIPHRYPFRNKTHNPYYSYLHFTGKPTRTGGTLGLDDKLSPAGVYYVFRSDRPKSTSYGLTRNLEIPTGIYAIYKLDNVLLKRLWNKDIDKDFIVFLSELSYEDIVQCFYSTLGEYNPNLQKNRRWQFWRKK